VKACWCDSTITSFPASQALPAQTNKNHWESKAKQAMCWSTRQECQSGTFKHDYNKFNMQNSSRQYADLNLYILKILFAFCITSLETATTTFIPITIFMVIFHINRVTIKFKKTLSTICFSLLNTIPNCFWNKHKTQYRSQANIEHIV